MRPTFFPILLLAFLVGSVAQSQEAIRNRAVRIIEESKPIDSGTPSQSPSATPTQAPSLDAAQPPAKSVMAPPALSDADRKFENAAGLKLELLPGTQVSIGDQMSVRVTTEKPGYLVVVDVDSEGHLTQIYPNTHSLATKEGAAPNANLLQKGKVRMIPDPKERSTFRFVAAPPNGVGMLVAILSDTPVQMIDLPDVPALMAGQKPALDYLRETTRQLKILPSSDREQIREPKWSFATQFYVIK